jgi:hypothetical protein
MLLFKDKTICKVPKEYDIDNKEDPTQIIVKEPDRKFRIELSDDHQDIDPKYGHDKHP